MFCNLFCLVSINPVLALIDHTLIDHNACIEVLPLKVPCWKHLVVLLKEADSLESC